jgi:hypothetical protein
MSEQPQEFKNKMKVSNPLNDLAANLGVTLKVLVQLAMGPDKEFREMVHMLLSALPEEEAVLVAEDRDIDPQFLDYLSRIFESKPVVLQTLIKNPSTSTTTVERLVKLLPSKDVEALAADPNVKPELLEQLFKIFGTTQTGLLRIIASNPVVPATLRQQLASIVPMEGISTEESREPSLEEDLESNFSIENILKATFEAGSIKDFEANTPASRCVNHLFEINAALITEFMKRIQAQVLTQLNRLTEANRQILQVILKNANSLNTESIELTSDLMLLVMQKLPASVSEQEILELLKKQGVEEEKPQEEEKEEAPDVSLQEQIKRMNVGEKMQLARKGDIAARRILIRDVDRDVALMVLENPKITDTEIEATAGMREVSEDVLRAISNKKEWATKYSVMLNLVKNPKTPVDLSVNFLARLGKRDLDYLQKSKSVPQIVRNYARSILLQRMQNKK